MSLPCTTAAGSNFVAALPIAIRLSQIPTHMLYLIPTLTDFSDQTPYEHSPNLPLTRTIT